MNEEFIKQVQNRLAEVSVTPSALRNQGSPGIITCCRQYFKSMCLKEFKTSLIGNDLEFNAYLDDHTDKLLNSFPVSNGNPKSWGAARKALNLFFREVVYNKFLSEHFNFPTNFSDYNKLISKLEIPLDKDVATEIYKRNPVLPRWPRIKKLEKPISELYQREATRIAAEQKTVRLHLDLDYWRGNQNN